MISIDEWKPRRVKPYNTAVRTALKIIQILGCTWILAMIAASFFLNGIIRSSNFERQLQIGQEISLFLAHLLILLLVEPPKAKTDFVCRLVAALLQQVFLTNSVYVFLEALQAFATSGNFSSRAIMRKSTAAVLAIGLPIIYSISTTIPDFDNLNSQFSCWANLNRLLTQVTEAVMLVFSFVSLIFAEAAGIHKIEKYLPLQSQAMQCSAEIRHTTLPWKVITNCLSYILGTRALYSLLAQFTAPVFFINIALGVLILSIHSLSNAKVRGVISLLLKKIMNK